MAADPAELQRMEAFVRALFQEKPDLSTLTNAIIRKKYLLHAGRESMAEEQKEQLRQLVAVELNRMEEDDSMNAVEFMAKFKTHIKSMIQKRPRCNSDTPGEELEIHELKKQRTGSIPEVSSDDKDSGIDSKKIPLRCDPKHVGAGKSSSCSDQRDSGAEGQAGGSESDGQSAKKRTRERPQRGKGSKPNREQQSRRQREQSGSESKETTEEEQSDLEEIRKHKAAKGQRIESESDSEQELSNYKTQKKKGFGKEQKLTETVGKGKNRNMDEQGRKMGEESEEDMELPKARKMCKGGRIDGSESEEEMKGSGGKKAQNRPRRRCLKAQGESEDESESDSEDEQPSRQNKMRRNSKRSRESMRAEELERDSDSAGGKSWAKKEMHKAARRANEKWSHNSESDSEDDGEFKRQASKGMKKTQKRKELEQGKHKPPKQSTSREESESERNECKSSEQKRKGTKKPSSSEDESCSETEEMERGKSKSKMSDGSSDESEDGSEEWESGKLRKKRELKKKGKSVSGSECSSEEESLRKEGEKSQGKHTIAEKDLGTDSEDSGSELVGRKKGLQKTGMQKPQRREASSSSGDEDDPRSSKRKGKDKEHHSRKNEEHSSIRRLKRYIRECGAHRNYKKLLSGCHSRKAQLKVLKEELENLGLKGAPTLAKCKALKQKREVAAEIASLDLCNIIATQGRPRRQNVWSLYSKPKQLSSPEDSPVHSPIRDWSHLKGVISSDGESN
ncbi:CHZ domain-containing protein [Podarcis lilfordi]|uniref:CHZ domain-containing protein n=2 Tax=Podarcis lilfordi TaxID=74358 RepID=A0AA35L7H1_9SAUR|nr:CHZ domain-containing protein [Podarcis lilfordi]